MDLHSAWERLGCHAGATIDEVTLAFEKKSQQLLASEKTAPTELLKKKFQQQQELLVEAYEMALSSFDKETVINVDSSGGAEVNEMPSQASSQPYQESSQGPSQKPSKRSSAASSFSASSLSETKLADLPGAGPGFEDATEAGIRLQSGQLLAGRYEIKEQIGAGGMGAVYHAFDQSKQEDIAVKVLLPSMVKNARARSRFMDEARISAKLSHPGIVNVFDVQQDGDYLFLTMELLEGQDLRSLMETRKLSRQPFDEVESKQLITALCTALNYAHKHTVHRDLKPENIWVAEEGDYKIMDFGIARVMSNSQRTQTGMAMGTAYYMAPEQLKGTAKVDGRADIYALGVLLYELLTGEVPAGRIKPLRELRKDLSKGFAHTIDQTLEPNPDDRFSDAEAFAAALDKKSLGLSLPAINTKWLAAAAVILLLAGVVGQGGVVQLWDKIRPLSEAEFLALQSEALQNQGEVDLLYKRLENKQRLLAQLLRDGSADIKRIKSQLRSGNSTQRELSATEKELAINERTHQLVDERIFSDKQWVQINGKLKVGETLLGQQSYQNASAMLLEVKDGLKRKLMQVAFAKLVLQGQDKAKARKISYDKLMTANKLTMMPQYQQLTKRYQELQDQFLDGEFEQASNGLLAISEDYRKQTQAGSALATEIDGAKKHQQRLDELIAANHLGEDKTAGKYQSDFDMALQTAQKGEVAPSLKALNSLNNNHLSYYAKVKHAIDNQKAVADLRQSWLIYKKDAKSLPTNAPSLASSGESNFQASTNALKQHEWVAAAAKAKKSRASYEPLLGGRKYALTFDVKQYRTEVVDGRDRYAVKYTYRKNGESSDNNFKNGSLLPPGTYRFTIWQPLSQRVSVNVNLLQNEVVKISLPNNSYQVSQLSTLMSEVDGKLDACETDTVYYDGGLSKDWYKVCQRDLSIDDCVITGEGYKYNKDYYCVDEWRDECRERNVSTSGSKSYKDFRVDLTHPSLSGASDIKPIKKGSDIKKVYLGNHYRTGMNLYSNSGSKMRYVLEKLNTMVDICQGKS